MADKKREIRITNVNTGLIKDLNNIADNVGVNLSAFLKMKLRDLADGYPEHMRKEKK